MKLLHGWKNKKYDREYWEANGGKLETVEKKSVLKIQQEPISETN